MLNKVQAVDWTIWPGPPEYRPHRVAPALAALLAVDSEAAATAAWMAVLAEIGNNHAGTLYPASAAAVGIILLIARAGAPWARWAALNILIDMLCFEPAQGHASFVDPTGRVCNVRLLLHGAIMSHADYFRSVAASVTAPSAERSAAQLLTRDIAALDDR